MPMAGGRVTCKLGYSENKYVAVYVGDKMKLGNVYVRFLKIVS